MRESGKSQNDPAITLERVTSRQPVRATGRTRLHQRALLAPPVSQANEPVPTSHVRSCSFDLDGDRAISENFIGVAGSDGLPGPLQK